MRYSFSFQPILQHTCVLLAAGFICTGSSQTVNLTGTVKDSSSQKAISGATVSLKKLSLSTMTDANGTYLLTGSSIQSQKNLYHLSRSPVFRNNTLFFNIPENEALVRLEVYDLSGRRIASLIDEKIARGSYHIAPLSAVTTGMVYLVKLQTGNHATIFKIPHVHELSMPTVISGKIAGKSALSRTAAVNDTLTISASGYTTVQKPISSYSGVNDFLMTPAGSHRGTISFENGSYQSCLVPLVITVVDSDLTVATIPIRVKSTTDPVGITVLLENMPGQTGVYSDSAFFSIVKSDSARRLIRVRDGDTVTATYADDSPAALCSERTVWNGLPGNVQPKGSPISGVIHGLGITLWDSDITDSIVTISVWSKKDTAGLRVSLNKVAFSNGDYLGHIGLTLRQSRGDSVLAVGPGSDTIFMRYHDLTPEADIMGNGCIWQPMPANMFLDSAQYHGIASVMTINLTDDDIEDSTAMVGIASRKDPTGIKDTLRVTGGTIRNFIGTVGFTTGASRPGFIAVQDADSVVVSYLDDSPVQTITQSAVWSLK